MKQLFTLLNCCGGASQWRSWQNCERSVSKRIYRFELFRWWKDAHDSLTGDSDGKRGLPFLASPGSSYAGPMKIINSIFSSDLVFNLRREEDSSQNSENGEVGISGRDYALVSGEMWVQALKWWVICHDLFKYFDCLNSIITIDNSSASWKEKKSIIVNGIHYCLSISPASELSSALNNRLFSFPKGKSFLQLHDLEHLLQFHTSTKPFPMRKKKKEKASICTSSSTLGTFLCPICFELSTFQIPVNFLSTWVCLFFSFFSSPKIIFTHIRLPVS